MKHIFRLALIAAGFGWVLPSPVHAQAQGAAHRRKSCCISLPLGSEWPRRPRVCFLAVVPVFQPDLTDIRCIHFDGPSTSQAWLLRAQKGSLMRRSPGFAFVSLVVSCFLMTSLCAIVRGEAVE